LLDSNDWFGVTISTHKNQADFEEPKAAKVGQRIYSLITAKEKGVNTWISCEPVLDTKTIYSLLTNFDYIDLFRIGKLNYVPNDTDWSAFGNECERIARTHNQKIYIKDGLRKEMGAE
jgi:DNA repair photolyase